MVMVMVMVEDEAMPLTVTTPLTLLTGIVCEISAITHILNNYILGSFLNIKIVLTD